MIVRNVQDGLELITQPDHAALAGRIMARWVTDGFPDSPRQASILRAVVEHDHGWLDVDASPIVDPATGRIADFISAPLSVRQGIWPRGVTRLADDPWAAALVAQHAIHVYARYTDDPDWQVGRIVLIGDALRTVHFSVGSGTRMALEDAIILAQAFAAHQDVGTALREFERVRRPTVEQFLPVAAHSFLWYEHMREKFPLAPLPFAYDYLMRSGTISHARLQERSPKFVAAYETYVATARAAHGQTSHEGDNVC